VPPRLDLPFDEWYKQNSTRLNKAPYGGVPSPLNPGVGMFGPSGNTPSWAPTGPPNRPSGRPGSPRPSDPPPSLRSPDSKYTSDPRTQPEPWIDDVDMGANWYSPFQPVWPFGPPYITQPREWDFPVGYNLNYIPRRGASSPP
jgi:hypothetical protein